MIEGRELIFLLDKDRFFANKRVRMKIYPKDKEGIKKIKRAKKIKKAKKIIKMKLIRNRFLKIKKIKAVKIRNNIKSQL